MSTHRDPELDDFVRDAVDGVEEAIDRDGAAGDLAAVLALAQQLDPRSVPPGWIEEASKLAPVVPLQSGRRMRQTRDDPDLDAVVAQVRAAVDQEVAVGLHQALQQQQASPACAAAVAPARSGSRRGMWIGLAAAAVLLLSTAALLSATLVQRLDRDRSLDSALSERAPTSQQDRPVPVPEPDGGPELDTVPEPDVVPELDTVPEPDTEPAPAKTPQRLRRSTKRSNPAPIPAETLEDRLVRLDAEAHRAWKAGDTAAAEAKFREIIRIGQRHRLADLAYGDLFTLARQGGQSQTKLWMSYLKRFPQGRFADDAQAGLCRARSGAAKAQCWQRYLEARPDGAYRNQARADLEESSEAR